MISVGNLNILLLILLIFQISINVNAELITYENHVIYPAQPEYVIIPKYDAKEVPPWQPGRGRSFIDLSHVNILSTCLMDKSLFPAKYVDNLCKETTVETLMFEVPTDRPWKDYWTTSAGYCCTQDLVAAGQCMSNKLGNLIVPTDLSGAILRSTKITAKSDYDVIEEGKTNIKHSGLYVILVAVCDENAAPVSLDGIIESVDPYGYLPADLFGDLPFYGALSGLYMVLGVIWLILCSFHSDQIMPLQYWITAVLTIGMIETTLLFAHYVDWNDTGRPAFALTFFGLLFGVSKRAMSRVLVLLVSLGYGVVRPSLGEEMNRALYLGSAYFILALIYTIAQNAPPNSKPIDESEYDAVSLVVFMLAIVDTTFYVWIFTSINNLLLSLASRRQGVKYLLYRNFRAILVVLLFFTFVWALYGSVLFLNDSSGANGNWRAKWTVDALWELIYFVILLSIAVLWAPSKNSQRYAYSAELSQLDDDSEWQQVSNAIEMTSTHESYGVDNNDGALDDEYGGRLQDEKDPFQGTGALDAAMAISKKA
eukprot:gene8195-11085_t